MTLTPRTRQALGIVQIDHTLVDIVVVDEVLRESMGRPWITVAIDIATRVVLGFALRLDPPSATSVGLALTMACLPKMIGSRSGISILSGRQQAYQSLSIWTMPRSFTALR
jgi:transposase InsO family protein